MDIDDRIEALRKSIAELHATAVVHSVNIESLHSSVSELHASLGELRSGIAELRVSTSQLHATAVHDGINIRTLADTVGALARIAESHGNRPTALEGGGSTKVQ